VSVSMTRRAAAMARAAGVRAPADRPSQRRCDREATSRAWTPGHSSRIQIRDAGEPGGPLAFDGFASVTDRAYEMWDMFGPYNEFVHVGAFTETLAASPDVPLVLDHTSSRRIARTGNASSPLMLSEVTSGETTGLQVLAPSLDLADPDTAYIVPKLRSGLIDEMSFRFMITSGRWSDDFDEYHIHSVDIDRGDVSIVGYGANPHTAGSGLRAAAAPALSTMARFELEASRADDDKYRHLTSR
jgi:HK97 family phage prohead protease